MCQSSLLYCQCFCAIPHLEAATLSVCSTWQLMTKSWCPTAHMTPGPFHILNNVIVIVIFVMYVWRVWYRLWLHDLSAVDTIKSSNTHTAVPRNNPEKRRACEWHHASHDMIGIFPSSLLYCQQKSENFLWQRCLGSDPPCKSIITVIASGIWEVCCRYCYQCCTLWYNITVSTLQEELL